MGEGRHALARRQLRHGKGLLAAVAWRIAGKDADPERALLQPLFHAGDDARGLVWRGERVLPPRAALRLLKERHGAGRLHPLLLRDPREQPRRREAVVDRPALPPDAVVRRRDRQRAGLELEGGGDAVKRLHARRRQVLPVRVQVDEPGRHDEPARVETVRPWSGVARDGGDAPVPDAHRPDVVEPRLRVDDASVGQHEVEGAAPAAPRLPVASAPSQPEATIREVRSKPARGVGVRDVACGSA